MMKNLAKVVVFTFTCIITWSLINTIKPHLLSARQSQTVATSDEGPVTITNVQGGDFRDDPIYKSSPQTTYKTIDDGSGGNTNTQRNAVESKPVPQLVATSRITGYDVQLGAGFATIQSVASITDARQNARYLWRLALLDQNDQVAYKHVYSNQVFTVNRNAEHTPTFNDVVPIPPEVTSVALSLHSIGSGTDPEEILDEEKAVGTLMAIATRKLVSLSK